MKGRLLPEGIDYNVLSSDPGDASDDCIHEGTSGPHEHRKESAMHYPVIRCLVAAVLIELAVMGFVVSARSVLDLWDAAHWQRLYYSEHFEYQRCDTKHAQLIKQIKAEKLWARLGMGGQPWLQ